MAEHRTTTADPAPDPLELLEAEIEVIWGPSRRTTEAPPSVVVAVSGDRLLIEGRHDLDRQLVREIAATARDQPPPLIIGLVQGHLRRALGPLEITVGPGYDCAAPAAQPDPVRGRLIRSDGADVDLDRLQVPPTWEEPDWRQLLDGRYGPWAMIIEGARVLSLCHSARVAPAGVEAGTWTAADARGLGLAAVATAAWADACRELPGHIFYSTDANNQSSQRVAARLGLPLLGQLWKLRPADEGDGPPDGRLSVIARR